MATRKKVTSSKKKSSKKSTVSRPKAKKVSKKLTASRPKTKKKATKPKAAKPKAKVVKLKKIKVAKPKPDTLLSCHKCGKNEKVNFAFMWANGWVRCCNEAMHLEDSSIKIGDVMNKAWINNGGYSGNFSVAKA